MPLERTIWMVSTSSESFEKLRARGFAGAAAPAGARAGDKVVFFLPEIEAFAATAAATDGGIEIENACPPGDYVALGPLRPHLGACEFLDRERLRDEDYETIWLEVKRRARGKRLPPGTPPTEAERPPKRPPKQ